MKINMPTLLTGGLVGITTCAGLVLSSVTTFADNDSATDDVNITVPVACSMAGHTDAAHNASLIPGTYSGASGSEYEQGIGKTTLTTFCNDNNGFSIYAIGFTGDSYDGENHTKLVGTTASGNATIATKVYESSDTTSNWSMKVTKVDDSTKSYNPANMSITNSFNNWHIVPDTYTKVAEYHATTGSSTTDTALGAKVETTYASYISTSQPADTYTGKVKYVLVHPYDATAPVIADAAILDTGKTVNSKLKSVAATVVNGEETIITPEFDPEGDYDYDYAYDEYIRSISVHTSTPAPTGFTPTEMNTISSATSTKPIYVIFDNTNNAGIMHFYTESSQIILSPDSSFMFYLTNQLSDLSAISNWDTLNVTDMSRMFDHAGSSATTFTLNLSSWNIANVTDMSGMFQGAGYSATTFTLNLSSWNTANVTGMSYMFAFAGYSATTWSIGDLSSWNTDNVTDMNTMFNGAGYSATTWSIGDLSSWNTDNVTDMSWMFAEAGYSATNFTIDLSSWNTSNVTDMISMFQNAGYSATTWSVTIPQTNGGSLSNSTTKFYGKTTSTYGYPDSGKSFTLAQPQP